MTTDPGVIAQPVHTAFTVSVTPELYAKRAAFVKKGLATLIFSLVISIAISWTLLRSYGQSFGLFPLIPLTPLKLLVVVLMCWPALHMLGRLVIRIVRHRNLRRALRVLVPGQVMRIERLGLVLRHSDHVEYLPWDQVAAVRGVRRWDTPGPELRVERTDGTHWTVPFAILDVLPGGIDGGLYAYSGGRLNLDMVVCDDIWSAQGR
ncbi:Uncharacterised protein [Propionibacterium australiense]|uniref:Uncharacterized protein n=1 Tax=Propionibacterium australiense TaxID=119981 RepID=A0A383S6P4_9ACTN|nr:Hypothetical protein PROPAUS_0847 [Propionibacterium australiense]VEH92397.1 Uncharacterised protein [Propionibacterium australiense]